jgi:hypothetical protein
VAEKSIAYAIANKTFENQTFNLRDSYGYAIYVDGELAVVKMGEQKAVVEDDRDGFGHDRGYELLVDHIPSTPYEVVIVAGEFYAATLEVIYHLDVLTHALQYTKELIR